MTPSSATPSFTNSTTSLVRTKRMSRSKFWTRATSARSPASKTSPASRSRVTVGSTSRPLFGMARRRRRVIGSSLQLWGSAARSRSSALRVAALAVMQPLGDAGDRGRARAGSARDLGVVHARVEQPDHRPALGHVVQLAERAQVAEEGRGLVGGIETQNRLEQLADGLVAPGFHRAHRCSSLVRLAGEVPLASLCPGLC